MGSTSQVVTALATTPLVVVPDCWHGPDQGHVVVGVDGSSACQDALAFGFEAVSSNASDLLAINATDLPETFPRPDVWLDRDDAPWQADARRLMGQALAGWETRYPAVGVRTQCVAGHPIHVLALASETADLVVVGGLGRTKFTPLRMGSVSRGLLHHTRCPVAVIHGADHV
jgi:nucleotide-binding universal stress UspA family protein